jgi:hypothetical protein
MVLAPVVTFAQSDKPLNFLMIWGDDILRFRFYGDKPVLWEK